MNITKQLFLFVLVLVCGLCQAQDELPTISADRPGALTGTDVMPRYKLQWETGIGYESMASGPRCFTLNSTLLRFGLFKNAEIRVGTDFLLFDEAKATEPMFGVAPLTVGMKAQFYEGTGLLPAVALLAELKSPHVGTKELLPSHLAPSLYLLFEHFVNDWFCIGYNVGSEWDGESATPNVFLGLGLYFDITDQIGAFVETYNYIHPHDGNQYLTEFGLTWLVSRRVQLDLAADLDFQNFGKHHVISAGVAWLIN